MIHLSQIYVQLLEQQRRNVQLPTGPSPEERVRTKMETDTKTIEKYVRDGFKGDLDLSFCFFEELPSELIKVGGDLLLNNSKIKSLNRLVTVGGTLNLLKCPIEDLGKLEIVGDNLELKKAPLKSLGNLTEVDGNLNLSFSQVTDLGKLKQVGGDLNLSNTNIRHLHRVEKIGGSLDVSDSEVTSLKFLKYLGGWFIRSNSYFEEDTYGDLQAQYGSNLFPDRD